MKDVRMFQAIAQCGCVIGSTYDDDVKAVSKLAKWAANNGYSTRFSPVGKDALPFYCQSHIAIRAALKEVE